MAILNEAQREYVQEQYAVSVAHDDFLEEMRRRRKLAEDFRQLVTTIGVDAKPIARSDAARMWRSGRSRI